MSQSLAVSKSNGIAEEASSSTRPEVEAALLTGCQDRSYSSGLALALASHHVRLHVVGNDRVDNPEFHTNRNLSFLDLGGIGMQQLEATFSEKLSRLLGYYARLVRYVTFGGPKLLHVLWNNKFEYFDRTFLMLYFKLIGKKLVFTAHNVNKAKRDNQESLLNRLTLRCQYQLADRIFVHTEKMKRELIDEFGVKENAVLIIPFGIYSMLPDTPLTPQQAKSRLGIAANEKTMLFFGRIVPYKGLEYLLAAFNQVYARDPNYRLIIAGEPMIGYEDYLADIKRTIESSAYRDRVIQKFQFIPDAETELYFKAADAFVLPYKHIFQSGVLFVGYTFGLPALGADVGSFREDILEGKTGYVFKPENPADLARAIETYFSSDLYKRLERNRQGIKEFVTKRHSWNDIGEITRGVYEQLLLSKRLGEISARS